ncbi:MAG: hypothetical protein KAR21_16615 [Spirochaetales bacterium]|nr:hypothetical protein [Spirochaetales bacterium]
MRTIKFTLFFLLFYIWKSLLLPGNEIGSKLDDNDFVTRVIHKEVNYSFCFLSGMDIRSANIDFDFSFESYFIRVGRLKRKGLWRELFNPLGVSAGSDLFSETPGLGKDYSYYSGGIYGLSYGVEKGPGLSILFTDNLWIGGHYTIGSDPFLITAFLSTGKYINSPFDDWTSDYPILPVTDPIHLGIHSFFEWKKLKIDYLGTLSGSAVYKAGSYNRLHLELLWKKLNIMGFGGITSPDFISSDASLAEEKYLLSLWIGLYPHKYWETILRFQYSKDHPPVLPVAYIPTSGSSSLTIKYDNSKFIFTSELGQKFDFDSNGTESVENKFDTRVGVSGKLSAFIGFGFSSDFDSLTERRFEINAGGSIRKTDLELVYKYKEEIYEPVDQHTFRVRVDREFEAGSVFIKVEIGEGWVPEGLSVGYKSVFE